MCNLNRSTGAKHSGLEALATGSVYFGDRKRELASSPVFKAMNRTVGAFDQRAVPFEHGRNLLALVRVNQKTNFVVSHCYSLWI